MSPAWKTGRLADGPDEGTKTACVFCNGELKDPARAGLMAARVDLLIAADGGMEHLVALKLKPNVIIGDMDSLGDAKPWNDQGVLRIPHPPEKDKSDAELAVEYALAHGCHQVILMAAVGKRLDHMVGNVALVARYPGRVAVVDGSFTLVAVDRSEKCILQGNVGATVSIVPYGPGEMRVKTRGLKYPLENEPLACATHGLSNELSETEACVCVSEGVLLVCIENTDTGTGE